MDLDMGVSVGAKKTAVTGQVTAVAFAFREGDPNYIGLKKLASVYSPQTAKASNN